MQFQETTHIHIYTHIHTHTHAPGSVKDAMGMSITAVQAVQAVDMWIFKYIDTVRVSNTIRIKTTTITSILVISISQVVNPNQTIKHMSYDECMNYYYRPVI